MTNKINYPRAVFENAMRIISDIQMVYMVCVPSMARLAEGEAYVF